MRERAGSYRRNFSGDLEYKSFLPCPLPPVPNIKLDTEILGLLSKANRAIGVLEGASRKVPNIELFVSMYVRKEALLSSQIEGTQATLDDILDPRIEKNLNQDLADVINYVKASQYAQQKLNELPICNRLIRKIHRILLSDVRGSEKNPGKFRKSQNWIGPAGSDIKSAKFIPPNVMDMETSMADLEKFINQDDRIDPLIKIALIHYQFVTIHPFLDGNGRIGRLLVNLFLMERKIITYETLYISYFLKRNKIEYYDRLNEVREKGNYEQWIKFFLLGLIESAEDSLEAIDKLSLLHEKNVEIINSTGRTKKTLMRLFSYLEASPIIDIGKTSKDLGLAYNTVAKAVESLMEEGILVQTENVARNRVFAYEDYLDILRKDI